MDTHIISAQEYYLATDVKSNYKPFFKGCQANVGKIISYHKLTNDKYTYARCNNGTLTPGIRVSNKLDKLYSSKSWVDRILINLGLIECDIDEDNHDETSDEPKVNYAPDVLELKDQEKITDDEGNIYDIEVRGERHPDKVYFKVKDISNQLNIPGLRKTLINPSTNYEEGKHYVKFDCIIDNRCQKSGHLLLQKSSNMHRLFLTYHGFIKVIYC